jgi:beta-glucosidase
VNPRTIVVLVSGSPVAMDPWLEKVPVVLQAWYGGIEGGRVLASVLFGDVNPSGKLPCTFPRRLADSPAHASGDKRQYPGVDGVVHYTEGLLVGYRWFDAKAIEPLFPFGHGLSYTTFSYANLRIESGGAKGALATVTCDITNTGRRAGAEVAQLYVHDDDSSVPRPPQELKGFAKVALAPGETKTVSFPLGQRAFAYYATGPKAWVAEAGTFTIKVGASSRDLRLTGSFALPQTLTVPVGP